MALVESSFSTDPRGSVAMSGVSVDPDGDGSAIRQPAHADARTLVFGLQIGGWSEVQAGNLAALMLGIRPADSGWRASEIEHLRFLRVLVETGRIAR